MDLWRARVPASLPIKNLKPNHWIFSQEVAEEAESRRLPLLPCLSRNNADEFHHYCMSPTEVSAASGSIFAFARGQSIPQPHRPGGLWLHGFIRLASVPSVAKNAEPGFPSGCSAVNHIPQFHRKRRARNAQRRTKSAHQIGSGWRRNTALLQVCQPLVPCLPVLPSTGRPDRAGRGSLSDTTTAAGNITFLQPESVGELPRGLGVRDFGLKDYFTSKYRICARSRRSSGRKSGCAMEMSSSPRSRSVLPWRLTTPYSVTTQCT